MAQPNPTKKGSPTVADYRTVQPFHAFGAVFQSVRNLLVKLNILHPKPTGKASKSAAKPAKHAAKASKPERRRH